MGADDKVPWYPLISPWKAHTFRVHIAVLFAAMIFLVGAVLVSSNYVNGRNIVLSGAEDVFERIAREISSEIILLRSPVEAVVDWMSRAPIADATTLEARMRSLRALADALDHHPMLESLYVGYSNGDFFQLHALRDEAERGRFGAPAHAVYRLQSIETLARRTRFTLLDSALDEITDLPVPRDYRFDPRSRPWYVEAMRSAELVHTVPYVFFTTREVGQTIARRAEHGRAVVGADMTLRRLSETLVRARPTPSSQLALFDIDGSVIAHSGAPREAKLDAEGNPLLASLVEVSPVLAAAMKDSRQLPKGESLQIQGREWLVHVVPTAQTAKGVTSLALATPSDELLVAARAALERNLWLALALMLLTAPFTWWMARRIAANLNALTGQAAAIRRFNFEAPVPLRSRIIEINELGLAMGQMRETVCKFVDITTALAAERKFDRLLRRALDEAREAAGADGGVIYLLDENGQTLRPADQSWGDVIAPGPENLPGLPMLSDANPVSLGARTTSAPRTDVLAPTRPPGLEFLTDRFGPAPVVLVTVPLLDRGGAVIGVLCVFLQGSAARPSPERLALVQAFAGAAAVAIDNQRLLAAQKTLFNALIGLIAGAIDAKSPYTGGHCQRVPALTTMLARAACDAEDGPFGDFDLDEDQWEALHIAAGLHDCGKVTTPEYVVDKATKLETLHDRIHEVRMRFEVLKRDAEIACLKSIAAGGERAELEATLASELRTLDEEFAFVARCNQGGEFMEPEKLERLRTIARRSWQRTLDDRIGISWLEAERKARTPVVPLPATEPLLADKPEHIIERGAVDLVSEDNPWGFKFRAPASLYNRGEIHNLSVARGTLTEEERYKINDHIVQTIVMLSSLPFPGHLRTVPELAGGHHEKMDGTGYPKGLRREDMSVQARIMAIADIFEALTASDRPYKKGKTLSEAIRIMSLMKKDRHIDPDLFDLFLRSGVYRRYAEKFMRPECIDEVDVDAHIGAPA
jgi:HD-GYP domain-containing protein (c-di-GMP phosphodiesterase class II)